MNKLESIVHNSAKLLDDECPGWQHHINLDELDMGTPSACIVGQLSEKFGDKWNAWNESRGFYIPGNSNILKPYWVNEIQQRLAV